MAISECRFGSFVASYVRDSAALISLLLDRSGLIIECNTGLLQELNLASADLVGQPCSRLLTAPDAGALVDCTLAGGAAPRLLNFVRRDHTVVTFRCRAEFDEDYILVLGEPLREEGGRLEDSLLHLNNEFAVLARENAHLRIAAEQANSALEVALHDLQTSYWHIQKMQEVLPICMRCNRVRNADASWQNLADYLKSNALFLSHGYCPECLEEWKKEQEL